MSAIEIKAKQNSLSALQILGLNTIRELETDLGILASGRQEIYGCIFGRDSLLTALKLLRAYERTGDSYLLALVKKVLANLSQLQGRTVNIESGEQPGKCIHEYRPFGHEHLTRRSNLPWYLYEDGIMRNYDSVDSTPLLLIAINRYWQLSGDQEFLSAMLPTVYAALEWIVFYGDSNGDGFVDYIFPPQRKYGGLITQSWMDSGESLFHEDGSPVPYPIAPVEIQGYVYLALKLWSNYFKNTNQAYADSLASKSQALKSAFNDKYVLHAKGEVSLAFALDGHGNPLTATRSSMGHCLWAALRPDLDGELDSILDVTLAAKLVDRLLRPDLFEPLAGIRTLSANSPHFDAFSYHNGSIWPHDNGLIVEGFENFGFNAEARLVRQAFSAAVGHFQTPIELFAYFNGKYGEWCSPEGQKACRQQAWSAATLLAESL